VADRAELMRRRRCRLLQLAMLFGALLVLFTRTWPTLAVAAVGEALLGYAWYRDCRTAGGAEDDAPPPG